MNINVLALNQAMDLAGVGTKQGYCRTISPQHYAKAAGLEWYAARAQLREYSRCGFLIANKGGKFYVKEFSVDD